MSVSSCLWPMFCLTILMSNLCRLINAHSIPVVKYLYSHFGFQLMFKCEDVGKITHWHFFCFLFFSSFVLSFLLFSFSNLFISSCLLQASEIEIYLNFYISIFYKLIHLKYYLLFGLCSLN